MEAKVGANHGDTVHMKEMPYFEGNGYVELDEEQTEESQEYGGMQF